MSDTGEIDATPAGYTAFRRVTQEIDKKTIEIGVATFGKGRTVAVRKLPLSKQWEIMSFSPPTSGSAWFLMAIIAASVTAIDEIPANPGKLTTQSISEVLDRLDDDGLTAARAAVNELADAGQTADELEAAHRAQVGNSPAPSASGGA